MILLQTTIYFRDFTSWYIQQRITKRTISKQQISEASMSHFEFRSHSRDSIYRLLYDINGLCMQRHNHICLIYSFQFQFNGYMFLERVKGIIWCQKCRQFNTTTLLIKQFFSHITSIFSRP